MVVPADLQEAAQAQQGRRALPGEVGDLDPLVPQPLPEVRLDEVGEGLDVRAGQGEPHRERVAEEDDAQVLRGVLLGLPVLAQGVAVPARLIGASLRVVIGAADVLHVGEEDVGVEAGGHHELQEQVGHADRDGGGPGGPGPLHQADETDEAVGQGGRDEEEDHDPVPDADGPGERSLDPPVPGLVEAARVPGVLDPPVAEEEVTDETEAHEREARDEERVEDGPGAHA